MVFIFILLNSLRSKKLTHNWCHPWVFLKLFQYNWKKRSHGRHHGTCEETTPPIFTLPSRIPTLITSSGCGRTGPDRIQIFDQSTCTCIVVASSQAGVCPPSSSITSGTLLKGVSGTPTAELPVPLSFHTIDFDLSNRNGVLFTVHQKVYVYKDTSYLHFPVVVVSFSLLKGLSTSFFYCPVDVRDTRVVLWGSRSFVVSTSVSQSLSTPTTWLLPLYIGVSPVFGTVGCSL